MEKIKTERLPTYADATSPPRSRPWSSGPRKRRALRIFALACLAYLGYSAWKIAKNTEQTSTLSIERLQQDFEVCSTLHSKPVDPSGFRTSNKRYVPSTKPLLIRNAAIWTGEPIPGTSEEDARAGKGWSWITGDVFLNKGLIEKVAPKIALESLPESTEVFEANGRQLTTGIVDMHSHAALTSVGNLEDDTNEMSTDITPYVRSLDGIDPLQPEFEFIKSGGVTTSLFLPGSGNNIGGEAYVLKFAVGPKNGRTEISQEDLFADPDKNWRYMKMACGENAKRVYGRVGKQGPVSRLGEAWEFRHAFEQAKNYVQEQDDWCAAATRIGPENMRSYLRQELKWESLGAVLRGQVRVNTHCYTIADLESFVRHTNEFQFRVYAFHHAHQTFLVPEVLKRAWGGTPAAALFADSMYYKMEAYRASERAGAILYAHNITPTYVSDNPVINSQHVVFEAAKAYGYGLPYHAALAGVTSAPAELLGLGNRVGKVKEGFDADIVVWDSDPLSAGATPVQVWIDGAPQFKNPIVLEKPVAPPLEHGPKTLEEMSATEVEGAVIFTGITQAYHSVLSDSLHQFGSAVAVVEHGQISCIGSCTNEVATIKSSNTPVKTINLSNGHITPPLTAFGAPLGLIEIDFASDTHDGPPPSEGLSRAVDGLFFDGKQLSHAFAHGVTRAISAPSTEGLDAKGISVGFHTGAQNALEDGAIWKDEVALHYVLTLGAKNGKTPSISSAIGALRAKLLDAVNESNDISATATPAKIQYEEKTYLKRVVNGTLPLVLSVHSADTIASIIRLKSEIETAISSLSQSPTPPSLRIVIIGAAEAHLVASSLASSNISVVLAPMLPHAQSWDQRRGLTGPPLTNSSVNILLDAGVLLGLSVDQIGETRDLNLYAGIAFANSEKRLSFRQALDLVGSNIDKMLGIGDEVEGVEARKRGWVVWEGSPLEIGGKVRAVGNVGRTMVWV